MGQNNGLHAFGCNSTDSEPIWMNSWTVWTKCWSQQILDVMRAAATIWEVSKILFLSG